MNSVFDKIFIVGFGEPSCLCSELLKKYDVSFSFLNYAYNKQSFINKRLNKIGITQIDFKPTNLSSILNIHKNILILSVNNSYLFPNDFFNHLNITIINYHNSLLPKFRGMHAEAWAIFNGCKSTGITWHLVNEGIDTGDILYQAQLDILPDMTSISLLQAQAKLAMNILETNLEQILCRNLFPITNNYKSGSIYYKKDKPGDGILNTEWPNQKIWNFLRAMDYGPYYNLGKPIIIIDGKQYSWKKYYKIESDNFNNSLEYKNGKIIINNFICLEDAYIVE